MGICRALGLCVYPSNTEESTVYEPTATRKKTSICPASVAFRVKHYIWTLSEKKKN